jgi:magnesium chelatase subunit I
VQVSCPRDIKLKISEICSLLDVDGIRGDMVINRAARALVAMEGRTEVTLDDVAKVIGLCLNHRCASLQPVHHLQT